MNLKKVYWTEMETPLGILTLEGDGSALTRIRFPGEKSQPEPCDEREENDAVFADARAQLTRYFDGEDVRFQLKLKPGGTDFQKSVWRQLLKIPRGQTCSYSDLAEKVGRPGAVRAVGAANGRNPLPIIVPCHRVVGKNGKLTGFAGGLASKARLLEIEGVKIEGEKISAGV